MKNFLKTMLTEQDNTSFCPIRVGIMLGILASIAFAGHQEITKGTLDIQNFCNGISGLLGCGGFGVAAKSFAGSDVKSKTETK